MRSQRLHTINVSACVRARCRSQLDISADHGLLPFLESSGNRQHVAFVQLREYELLCQIQGCAVRYATGVCAIAACACSLTKVLLLGLPRTLCVDLTRASATYGEEDLAAFRFLHGMAREVKVCAHASVGSYRVPAPCVRRRL